MQRERERTTYHNQVNANGILGRWPSQELNVNGAIALRDPAYTCVAGTRPEKYGASSARVGHEARIGNGDAAYVALRNPPTFHL